MRGGSRLARVDSGVRRTSALLALLAVLALAPWGSSAQPADVTVGSVLDAQRERYEAFQRRQQQRYEDFQEDRQADYEAFRERMQAAYARYVGIVEEVRSAEERRVAATAFTPGDCTSHKLTSR